MLVVTFLVRLGISGSYGLSHAKIQNKAPARSSGIPPNVQKDTAIRYKECRTNLEKVGTSHTGDQLLTDAR